MKEIYGHRIWNKMNYQSCWGFKSEDEAKKDLELVIGAFCYFTFPEASAETFKRDEGTLNTYSFIYDKKQKKFRLIV